ncbi:hypothetical protein ABT218_08040 [Streptomyces sp. NPDC001455]|uniref:hypothetical protein n=1 Tax=Streptomyces sp. NPDC001455 TaxID=3154518 RepID=UPI00332C24C3
MDGDAHDYSLVLVPPSLDGCPFDSLPLDGTIVIDPLTDDPLLGRLSGMGVPVVTTGRDLSRKDAFPWVDNELSTCAVAALDHLAATGARRKAADRIDPASPTARTRPTPTATGAGEPAVPCSWTGPSPGPIPPPPRTACRPARTDPTRCTS